MSEIRESLPAKLAARMEACPQFFDILEEYAKHMRELHRSSLERVQDETYTTILRGQIEALRKIIGLRDHARNILNGVKNPFDSID